jgi:hypothetical protein
MVKKASSTFDAFFVEVSRKGTPKLAAYALALSVETTFLLLLLLFLVLV